jgi:hypothetical protein
MTDSNETTPQRARRLAKEYAGEFLSEWNPHDRKWMQYAWTRGYQGACEDLADTIDALVDRIEPGDYDALVAALDALLDRIDSREQVAA